jgi:phosphate:Na+ symporter
MLTIAGSLLGGVGLFILAVSMITSGLKLAAGETLQDLLGRYTSTPLRGLASGMLVTGLVRSSSAVTVATIGFVNAGLLTLPQSLGVVYGANLGTTTTAWLVAAVGLDFKIETLALPMIGIGMLLRLTGRDTRAGGIGEALAGFGLFFIGIEVLRQAFAGFSDQVDVTALAPGGIRGVVLYVGLGFLMTLITQSSSAAIAVILSAASGGALPIDAAAATVIGANLGTTSTAALAAIGATANARRVAAAHVVFNGVTGIVALVLLPVLVWTAAMTGELLGIHAPAAKLAVFHTVFNVLGVLIMWPFTGRLAEYLAGRFVTQAETLGRPQYLDRSVRVAPELAVQAMQRELARAAELATEVGTTAVRGHSNSNGAHGYRARLEGLRSLLKAIGSFVADMESSRASPDAVPEVPELLRVSNYLEDVAVLAADLDLHRGDINSIVEEPVRQAVVDFQEAIVAQLHRCGALAAALEAARKSQEAATAPLALTEPDETNEGGPEAGPALRERELQPQQAEGALEDARALQDSLATLDHRWHDLKNTLLRAGVQGRLPLGRLNRAIDGLRSALKMAEQQSKAVGRLMTLYAEAPAGSPGDGPSNGSAPVAGPDDSGPPADRAPSNEPAPHPAMPPSGT